MTARLELVASLALLLSCASCARPPEPRLSVVPILFVPSDSVLPEARAAQLTELLGRHFEIAQARYEKLLVTDTFEVEAVAVHHGSLTAQGYAQASPDSAHAMVKELFAASDEDRNGSTRVLVAVMVRPEGVACEPCLGGGRTFNGPPGSGGGIVQLEASSLERDAPYPFGSTLVHELGHAFGLTHSDCLGEDLQSGRSIMSYNPSHHSRGLDESVTPGELLPAEYSLLSENELAFPAFTFDPSTHNPTGAPLVGADGTCELRAMDGSLGPMARRGYELFFDDKLVSGPDAQFFTRGEARTNCRSNVANNPGVTVRCTFDGIPFE